MATKKHSATYYVLWLPIKYTGLGIGYGGYYLGRGFGWSLYQIGKGIGKSTSYLTTKTKAAHVQHTLTKAQPRTPPVYVPLTEVKNLHGSVAAFEHHFLSKPSTIGIILGARGSGKSAIGMKLLENMHAKTHRTVCAMGFKPETLPAWISSVQTVDAIPNNSVVLLDEAGITFSSRSSMSSANKLLSSLLLITRHKDLSVLFIAQNSSNLEINAIRQADFLILKPSSLLQKDFERSTIKDIYTEAEPHFKALHQHEGLTYIYSDAFKGFITNPLPTFWSQKTSKAFSQK